jgi:late competence protein required for DNA uptake (superfamily II DNA/RNA helicase)
MSASLATLRQRRCDNHPNREASARCPECGRFFCRECITEHDDRVVCASCLAKLTTKKTMDGKSWTWAPKLGLALLAVAIVYFFLLLIGNLLVSIPSQFHAHGGW